ESGHRRLLSISLSQPAKAAPKARPILAQATPRVNNSCGFGSFEGATYHGDFRLPLQGKNELHNANQGVALGCIRLAFQAKRYQQSLWSRYRSRVSPSVVNIR